MNADDGRSTSLTTMNAAAAPQSRSPRLLPRTDAATAYRLIYGRIDALLRGRADVAERPVPACPAWTVRQTVAHLAGVAQDVAALNMAGMTTEAWTQAQVDRLDDHSLDELLDLWWQSVDPVTTRLQRGAPDEAAGQLVFDTLTHEHDIRGALREPGSRTADLPFDVAAGFLTTAYDRQIRETGLPTFMLTTPALGSVRLGDDDAARGHIALRVSDFEALRALGGRRSSAQLRTLPWQGDPTNLLSALGNAAIRPPDDDLVE